MGTYYGNIMKDLTATETQTQEVMSMLPEELADLLSEKALEELHEANKVPFTPVQDAAKLDQTIANIQKKLNYLISVDVEQALKKDLEGFAKLEDETGKTRDVALINQVSPSFEVIMALEGQISNAVARYQKLLLDSLKAKRLLSGQMFGTRLAHTAQVSRMKRVRQITVTGNDLLKEFAPGSQVNPKIEMEPVQKVVELFPKEEPIEVNFEPLPDTLPFQVGEPSVYKVVEKEETKSKDEDDIYCSSYED